jgi:hypothetical protein
MHTSPRASFEALENANLFNAGGCPLRLAPVNIGVI